MTDELREIAEIAAKRKAQVREWAAKQANPDHAVTFLPEYDNTVDVAEAQESPEPGPADPVFADKEEARKGVPTIIENPGPADQAISDEEVKAQEDKAEEKVADPGEADPVFEEDADNDTDEPDHNALKGDWVAYRIKTHGLTEDQANEKTKAQLIAADF